MGGSRNSRTPRPAFRTVVVAVRGASAMTPVGRRDTIVVADADCGFREQVCTLLSDVGYHVSDVTTGPEALEVVRRLRPRLVVLDVQLPDICGYEVCQELRDEFGPGLPVLFVSAERTEPPDRIAGLLLGADDYLAKPIAP